jgi:hypothetical protein
MSLRFFCPSCGLSLTESRLLCSCGSCWSVTLVAGKVKSLFRLEHSVPEIDAESLSWLYESAEYQQDPFSDKWDSHTGFQQFNRSFVTDEDRESRIKAAVAAGDTRQRAKRGLPAASGRIQKAKIDRLGEGPEECPYHVGSCFSGCPGWKGSKKAADWYTGVSTEDVPTPATVRDGYYTVVFSESSYRTLRVRTQAQDANFAPGKQILSFLSGSDNENSYTGFGILNPDKTVTLWRKFRDTETGKSLLAATEILTRDPSEAGLEFALRSNRCCRCSRTLTVPASIHQGMGPECATKV